MSGYGQSQRDQMGRSHYIQQIFSGNNSKRLAVQFSDARKDFKNIADKHAEMQ